MRGTILLIVLELALLLLLVGVSVASGLLLPEATLVAVMVLAAVNVIGLAIIL